MKNSVLIILFFIVNSINLLAQNHNRLDSIFAEWSASKQNKPGLAIAVIKEHKIVYKKAFGYANLEYDIPITTKSVFDIASVSKQFTGFAIAKLILEGKLSLEEKIKNFFPELDHLSDQLKIKHLVYHTSGLIDVESIYARGSYSCRWTAEEALEMLKEHPDLHFPEGSRYDYSNTNYVLLALIVEKVTKVSFRDWCHTNIFKPLGMNHTFVGNDPKEIIKNRATAYYQEGDKFNFHQQNGMSLIGSSSVYTTIEDLAKWTIILEQEKHFPKIFQMMKKKGTLDNGEELNYGLGLFDIINNQNLKVIYHLGGTRAGFRAGMILFPDQNFSFVLLSNWGNIRPDQYTPALIENFIK